MLFKSLKAHASRHALLALAVCAMIPCPAAMAEAPVFTPATGWEVNAGQLSQVRGLKSMKMPCVISTEYDNGFVVRFSGGGNKMMALAIDFRQDAFRQGRQYDAMLSVGGGYVKQVKATAFTKSTLIFNLRPIPDFYTVAQGGGDMEIQIDGNTMKFSLGRIGAVFGQLESCYAGSGNAAPVKPVMTQTASKAPVEGVQAEPLYQKPLPSSLNDIVRNADVDNAETTKQIKLSRAYPRPAKLSAERSSSPSVTPMPDKVAANAGSVSSAANSSSAPVPIAPSSAPVPAPRAGATWEAEAGEDMKIVLTRWAERAGYDLDWQSAQNGIVAQDLKVSGSFEDAVSQLLAENSAATGIGAHVETVGGAAKPIGPSGASVQPATMTPMPIGPAPSSSSSGTQQASIPAMRDDWVAAPGANIQPVLEQWSSRAGVAIVWQTYMDFAVKFPIRVSGSYEEAVQKLLDQFMNDSVRPIGQLNTDPETGARTLLVDKSR